FDASGRPKPDSPFDRPGAQAASVLVAGRNFGCGSSREHAAWALRDFGFRVVIAPELADIFRRNALKNSLVAFEVSPSVHARLRAEPGAEVTVDLEHQTLTLPDGEPIGFEIDRFARHCLLHGVDELEFLRDQELCIQRFEEASPRRSLQVPVR
ncbi:MAG: 3-isopropylmalate dehydratase small subunit, partial [Acidobacteriota bacterium]